MQENAERCPGLHSQLVSGNDPIESHPGAGGHGRGGRVQDPGHPADTGRRPNLLSLQPETAGVESDTHLHRPEYEILEVEGERKHGLPSRHAGLRYAKN
jgi:hypothetical protein